MIAAIYARKSTDQTGVADDAKSVGRQIEHARAFAARKGWTIDDGHIYVDDGISGAEFENRPGFMRLMNVLQPAQTPFDALIMSEESRLGREQIETAYALKRLVTSGVRVFSYLADREITLSNPLEKAMMSLQAMADEMERKRASERTHDALAQRARAGYVTGGKVFGYRNVRTDSGRVMREINPAEADVVRRIFALCAANNGLKTIAKRLNEDGAPCPMPRRRDGEPRPPGWAPSSVREVLYRDLYRGRVVWNRTRKRNAWGQARQSARPESEWLTAEAPDLRIVTDTQWNAAQARLASARAMYLRGSGGELWGKPDGARGNESKYLLVGLARCGLCGGGLSHVSGSHGKRRASFYACTVHWTRGATQCHNNQRWSMALLDDSALEIVRQQILSETIINAAVQRALAVLTAPRPIAPPDDVVIAKNELDAMNAELARLTTALAAGGDLPSILDAIKGREVRKRALERRLAAATMPARQNAVIVDRRALETALRRRLEEWRAPLQEQTAKARQLLRKVLVGRLVVTPEDDGLTIAGTATLGKFFAGIAAPKGLASPPGFEPGFQP